jgi:cysteine desulfurase
MPRIYFDNAATTPLDPRVLEAMLPFLKNDWGNPSSLHREGCLAREAVETARNQVARLIGAESSEIVFTSNGTEADNLAIFGFLPSDRLSECHLITSTIEHPAMLECCRSLERGGLPISYLPVSGEGLVNPADLDEVLDSCATGILPVSSSNEDKQLGVTTGTGKMPVAPIIVSVMAANNVTGVLQPIAELARITVRHGALFHTDAVQAAGKIPLNVSRMPIDLLSVSAHKMHGPKGVGALFVRRGLKPAPLLHGGGQESGLRSGTENVAGIVGFGRAAELALAEMAEEAARLVQIRDLLIDSAFQLFDNAYLIGDRYRRLPGHICLGFAGQEGEAIKLLLDLDEQGIAVSSGSACSNHHAGQPSHVLQAMGFDATRARGSLRISLGRFNTRKEVERFLEVLPDAVRNMRSISSLARVG